jgi:hypothetical protein
MKDNTIKLTQDQIDSAASELSNWLQSAVADVAAGQCMMETGNWDEVDCYAQSECAADDLYEDPDTLRDLLGDRIYDTGKGHWPTMILIAMKIKDRSHTALTKACDFMINDWTAHAKIVVAVGEFPTRMGVPALKYKCPECKSVLFGGNLIKHLMTKHDWDKPEAMAALNNCLNS